MPDVFTQPQKPATTPPVTDALTLPSHVGLFSMLAHRPTGVHFQAQESDETIILLLRQHIITQLSWVIVVLLLFTSPPTVYYIYTMIATPIVGIPAGYILVLSAFYYLILLGYAFINYIIWFYNLGIVTNKRIVDIDVESISTKNVATTRIEDVGEVNYTQNGFLRSSYDYGDITIHTQTIHPNFEFSSVPKPAQVADIILELMGRTDQHE